MRIIAITSFLLIFLQINLTATASTTGPSANLTFTLLKFLTGKEIVDLRKIKDEHIHFIADQEQSNIYVLPHNKVSDFSELSISYESCEITVSFENITLLIRYPSHISENDFGKIKLSRENFIFLH